ncbi:MAG: hypothetical protein ACYTAN_11470, partial [Planctomycetota bacterium]
MTLSLLLACALLLYAISLTVGGEQGIVTSEMLFVEHEPRRFPVVNVHWHIGDEDESIDLAVRVMDETGVAASVDLSGGTGEKLRRKVELA